MWKQGLDKQQLNREQHQESRSHQFELMSHPEVHQFQRGMALGQSTPCVTYHVSTDGLGHHAPNGSFGASSCWHSWGGWWDQDWRDGGLWRRRSWSRRRGDMNRSWHRWRHRRRRLGPRCRSGRFGLWSWHHLADDSVGPTLRIVRADGRESNNWSLTREKENIEQLIHVTLQSPKRLFEPHTRTVVSAAPIHLQDKAQSHYKVNASTAWASLYLTVV